MGKTVKQIAEEYGMSPANIYYHLTRLGIKKEKDKYKNPNIYSGKDLDILLEKINEHKLNRENVDYWKNKSRKLGNENKKLKRTVKSLTNIKNELEILDKLVDTDLIYEEKGE